MKQATILLLGATLAAAFGCQRNLGSTLEADGAAAGAAGAATAAAGDIKVSLAHPYDLKHDDFELVFGVPNTVGSVSVCEVRIDATCAAGGAGVFGSKLVFATDARKFFKANATALLESGLMLKIIALDKSGAQVDARMIAFSGTGSLKAASQPTATLTPAPTTAPSNNGQGDQGNDQGDDSGAN